MQNTSTISKELAADAKSLGTAVTPQTSPAQTGIDADLLSIIDELAAEVRKCAAHALGWRISMGVRLREYQDGMDSEDWNQVLESRRLPFSARTAQMLTRIGSHKIFADLKRTHQLPNSITVLNELAALPLPVIEQALVEGRVQPSTTLWQAQDLVDQHRIAKGLRPTIKSI